MRAKIEREKEKKDKETDLILKILHELFLPLLAILVGTQVHGVCILLLLQLMVQLFILSTQLLVLQLKVSHLGLKGDYLLNL